MRAASDHFLRSLRLSHVIAASCELYFPGDPDPVNVPVQGGQITIDRTAQSRRRGTVQIPWSLAAGADLGVDLRTLPLGGYALVRRGLRYANGQTELMLLGRLRVESVTWGTEDESASLELADRMAQVRDEPFTSPYAAGGKRAAQAAVEIVQGVFGATIGYSTPQDPPTVLSDVFYSGARSEALTELEQSASAESYFDANGDFVFAAKPGDSEPVVWEVDAGETGVMISAGENLDRTGIYNGVLVQGQDQATNVPFSALATYDNPASPIRWGGPFGKVALVADSTAVQDTAQALAMAQSLLRLRLKQTRSLELSAAPNPALEAGDTIRVRFPDGRTETHLIDATTIALTTDAQAITTRTLADPLASAPLAAEGGEMADAYLGRQAWRELNDARLVGA
jgi:hypothetical protein